MAYTVDELKWQSLTALVNEIKTPLSFLKNKLFKREEMLSTETAEIDYLTGGVEAAPMVRVNGEARMVEGLGQKFATVTMPNIRIKRPLTPSDLLFGRTAGSVIFPTRQAQLSAIQAHIARDAKRLVDLVANREEWFAAMALRGEVTYSVEDEEVFTITFPRSASHAVTASPLWSNANSKPATDCLTAKRLINADTGLNPTDVILGKNAAVAFLDNSQVQSQLDARNYEVGAVDRTREFGQDGALYLGRFAGLRFWEYSRTMTVDGSTVSLIRDDYAEFVCATPSNEFITYYGAIPDWDALEGKKFIGKRFSKSWMEKDPSVRQLLLHSRPLCVPRIPDSTVSMKVA
jgi:hypothetical protein